jgi:STE24 endopeptidase
MNTYLAIILFIIITEFVLEQLLDYLNYKNRNAAIPDELKDLYNPAEYKKQQDYEKTTGSLSFISSSFNLIIIVLMLTLNGFALINQIATSNTNSPILSALIFFGILLLASDILNTPFAIYSTFVIEEKFGFNKTTPKTFLSDKIKSWIISSIILSIILSAIIWFYTIGGTYFWIYAWGFITLFMIIMAMFYSNLIVPLFNKQTPLEDSQLKNEIEAFASKVGFKITNIYKIDGSKRSTKANAYFSGLGKKKRIVLYDTLINKLTTQEIVAVLAHEIGHYKKKHTLQSMIINILETGIMLYIFSLFVNNIELNKALGVNKIYFHISLLAFGLIYSPISTFTGLITNILSRKNEYEADNFAKTNYNAEHLISALKKLSKQSLSNLTPHPVYVFFHYSHPTLYQRIKKLKN